MNRDTLLELNRTELALFRRWHEREGRGKKTENDYTKSGSLTSDSLRRNFCAVVAVWLCHVMSASAAPNKLPRCEPAEAGFAADRLAAIDAVVREGLDAKRMPGCVIAFGRNGKLAWLKAYGNRCVQPMVEPMTTDTVFDMASITKPVATATSVMLLVEQGKVRLRNRFSSYFPGFAVNGKKSITVTQMLTHHGGLIPDNAVGDYDHGAEEAWRRIENLSTYVEPGSKFVYTDVGFIALAELIRKQSGLDVHQFSQRHIFRPLGMDETGYLPNDALRKRAVTTEQREGRWMRGEVHDPRAYRLGGIAGHAGLFSTAEDLAVYAEMMLNEGVYQGVRILSPAMTRVMTRGYDVSGNVRGLGWDKLSVYSSNRGETFSEAAFGHGGFTGTVFWMDPELDLFFIFLSNRVHPDGRGNVNSLAGRIATIIAGAIVPKETPVPEASAAEASSDGRDQPVSAELPPRDEPVVSGLVSLQQQGFEPLKGQRIGLITNHTGVDARYHSSVRLLHQTPQVELTALFSPEHGIAGKLDVAKIEDSDDETTGLRVYSLYGKSRKPTAEQLAAVDTLVFDIQDIGSRFYTYISTMGLAMQAAAEHGKRFVVLDRPNPIGGTVIDGPMLDEGKESFVAFHQLPVRHGMTIGELAQMFRSDLGLEALELRVIPMTGWTRTQTFDQTGLPWVNPSPNMRTLNQALLYPGIGLLETTNLSVGRGTDTPFEWLGAPWMDAIGLSDYLNGLDLPGIRFIPDRRTPRSSVFADELCHGIQVLITDRARVNPTDVGFAIAHALRTLHPDYWDIRRYDRLLGNQRVFDAVDQGKTHEEIRQLFEPQLEAFRRHRASFLIYE